MGMGERDFGKPNDKLPLPLSAEVSLSRIQGVRVVTIEGVRIDYGDEEKD
jgi:hypothetical protein